MINQLIFFRVNYVLKRFLNFILDMIENQFHNINIIDSLIHVYHLSGSIL